MTNNIKFYSGENIPLELHKVRVVQKLHLVPIERRLQALEEGGFNTFKLNTTDVFLDMLTDSGTNAMSDNQVAAMFHADDAYAGSQSFVRLLKAVQEVLGKEFLLPVHQGRAAENIICRTFIKPGQIIPMNYHFTTALAHITENGGKIAELLCDDALDIQSVNPFKGNIDIQKLKKCIQKHGAENIPFIRMEASTNLIGGQPFSIHNLQQVREVADQHGIMLVLDASLLGEKCLSRETTGRGMEKYLSFRNSKSDDRIGRSRLLLCPQTQLFPGWRYMHEQPGSLLENGSSHPPL